MIVTGFGFGRRRQIRTFIDEEIRNTSLYGNIGIARIGVSIIGNSAYNWNLLNYFERDKRAPFYCGASYCGGWSRNTAYLDDIALGLVKYAVFISIYNQYGGLKKSYFKNSDNDNPIKSIKFQLIPQGFGNASINFSYLDFPIVHEDQVIIYLNETPVYRGYVEEDVEISNMKCNLYAKNKRLKEVLYNATYTNTAVLTILQHMISSTSTFTGVLWDVTKIDLGTVPVQTITYNNDILSSKIDDLVSKCYNRYWGVDIDNYFFVKEEKQTTYTKFLWNTDDSCYEKITVNKDTSKIKATEYLVYKPISGTDTYIGMVGDVGNTTYPPLPLSYTMRRIQNKIKASEVLSDVSALEWAYAELTNEMKKILSIQISNIDIERYLPAIGDYILIEDSYNYSFIDLITCEDTTNWTNVTLGTGIGINSTNCIKLFNTIGNISYYDFGEIKEWWNIKKIGLYINTALAGREIEIGLTDDLGTITYTKHYCRNVGIFEYYDIDYTEGFRYIVFKNTNTDVQNIYIDNIVLLALTKQQYSDNITEINMEVSENSKINCDITTGNVIDYINSTLFEMRKKIEILEKNKEG